MDIRFNADTDYRIVCSFCGFECVHQGYALNFEGVRYVDGRPVTAPMLIHPAVGDLLVIPFWCEDGCKWLLCLRQHKGFTFIETERLPDDVGEMSTKADAMSALSRLKTTQVCA